MKVEIGKFFQGKSSNDWQSVFVFENVLQRHFQLRIKMFSFSIFAVNWNMNNELSLYGKFLTWKFSAVTVNNVPHL